MDRSGRVLVATALSLGALAGAIVVLAPGARATRDRIPPRHGVSVAFPSDGRHLILGDPRGGAPSREVWQFDPATGSSERLVGGLMIARVGHSATLLPDATVLVIGGVGVSGEALGIAERFDPESGASAVAHDGNFVPRVDHTATLLTDGRVLVAGGTNGSNTMVAEAELYDWRSGQTVRLGLPMPTPRARHAAMLSASGLVAIGGGWDKSERASRHVLLFAPDTDEWLAIGPTEFPVDTEPEVVATIPTDRSEDNPVDREIVARFGTRLAQDSVSAATVVLTGPGGAEPIELVVAEAGRLLFVRPARPLEPATTYRLRLEGLRDQQGRGVEDYLLTFSTARKSGEANEPDPEPLDDEAPDGEVSERRTDKSEDSGGVWVPSGPPGADHWRTNWPPSPWAALPPLQAPAGVTALAGQVLRIDGKPIRKVSLVIDGYSTKTDATGRFLLTSLPAGRRELEIDGGRKHGRYEVGVTVAGGVTTALPYTIWLPRIDRAHEVRIPSPTTDEMSVSTPYIPGLALHLPAWTIIRDHEGNPVTRVGITPIPIDRPPFPLPEDGQVPVYFTVQPGGSYVWSYGAGARLVYPNYHDHPAGTRFDFWHYDPGERGWYVYGEGSVQRDRQTITPDPGVSIYELTGAMVMPPSPGGCPGCDCSGGASAPGCGGCDGGGPAGGGGGGPGGGAGGNGGSGFGSGAGFGGGGSAVAVGGGGAAPAASTALVAAVAEAGPSGNQRIGPSGTYDGAGVSLGSGLFVMRDIDVYFPDVVPIALTRTYRPGDGVVRSFGIGSTHSYDIHLEGDLDEYIELVLTDRRRIRYDTTAGFGGPFEHTATPGPFYQTRLVYSLLTPAAARWPLKLRDGTVWVFPDADSFLHSKLQEVRDRFGNRLTISREAITGRAQRITSPSGQWVQFAYQGDVVTTVTDSVGRQVTYGYLGDGSNRLASVTDVGGGVTTYTWEGLTDRIGTVRSPRQNAECPLPGCQELPFLTNEYYQSGPEAGLVKKQTFADGTTYQFAYSFDTSGNVIATDVANRRGFLRHVVFNAAGYVVSDTRAVGRPEEQTVAAARNPAVHPDSNLVTAITDSLVIPGVGTNRRTEFNYADDGSVTQVRELANTAAPIATTFTYEPSFQQLARVTDPLGHTTTVEFDPVDPSRRPTSVTDATQRRLRLRVDGSGQLASFDEPFLAASPPVSPHTFTLGYESRRLTTFTDPTQRTSQSSYDAGGRVRAARDSAGESTQFEYNAFNRLTRIVYPTGEDTQLTYDADGNLRTVRDARGKVTQYGYDRMNRQTSRTDPLGRTETFAYDGQNNLTHHIDRRGKATRIDYDPLNRPSFASWGGTPPNAQSPESTTGFVWDAGNRLTGVVDSVTSIIVRTYDALDNLTSETTAEGAVEYEYDDASRRIRMDVGGQSTVLYEYDDADRLTDITRDLTQHVEIAYDAAGRRGVFTLPNGKGATHSYDAASRLTSILYSLGPTTAKDIFYRYDSGGRRNEVGGLWSRTNLPAAVSAVTHDDANRILQWGTTPYTHDHEGNLTSDGAHGYAWDGRGQLSALLGANMASFTYDPLGRRTRKVVNSTTTRVLYDGLNPVRELDAGGAVLAQLVAGLELDEHYARVVGGTTETFLSDALGSTVALATSTQPTVSTEYTYGPYGETTQTGTASSNALRFTGREADLGDLYYYRARFYRPSSGRFASEDPIEFLAGASCRYSYVGADPVNFNDPQGLYASLVLRGLVAGWRAVLAGGAAVYDFCRNPKTHLAIIRLIQALQGGPGAISGRAPDQYTPPPPPPPPIIRKK